MNRVQLLQNDVGGTHHTGACAQCCAPASPLAGLVPRRIYGLSALHPHLSSMSEEPAAIFQAGTEGFI